MMKQLLSGALGALLGILACLTVLQLQQGVNPHDYLNERIYKVDDQTYTRAEILDFLIVRSIQYAKKEKP